MPFAKWREGKEVAEHVASHHSPDPMDIADKHDACAAMNEEGQVSVIG
jgi:hypothetical protein